MRTIVQPPPSLYCDICHGELQVKQLVPEGPSFEFDTEVFVCAKCGHEQSHRVIHDRYAANAAIRVQPAKAG
jgi:hypothetical protein